MSLGRRIKPNLVFLMFGRSRRSVKSLIWIRLDSRRFFLRTARPQMPRSRKTQKRISDTLSRSIFTVLKLYQLALARAFPMRNYTCSSPTTLTSLSSIIIRTTSRPQDSQLLLFNSIQQQLHAQALATKFPLFSILLTNPPD